MKTLAIMGIIIPVAVRVATVIKKPSNPVITFDGESCIIAKRKIPPIVVAATPEMSILPKSSERLFNAPAMYPISIALRTQPSMVGPKPMDPRGDAVKEKAPNLTGKPHRVDAAHQEAGGASSPSVPNKTKQEWNANNNDELFNLAYDADDYAHSAVHAAASHNQWSDEVEANDYQNHEYRRYYSIDDVASAPILPSDGHTRASQKPWSTLVRIYRFSKNLLAKNYPIFYFLIHIKKAKIPP